MDLSTYLFCDGRCEEAFKVDERVLGGETSSLMRCANVKAAPMSFKANDSLIHASLKLGDHMLLGSDTPPASCAKPGQQYIKPQGFRANIGVETPGEAERIVSVLGEGGSVAMPMAETFFARRFGMLTDHCGTP